MADLLRIPIYLIRPEQIGCQPYRIIGIWFTLRHTWWWSICSVISSRHFPRNYCEWLWLRWQMWYMPDTYHQSHAMVESRRLLFINPPFFFFAFSLPSPKCKSYSCTTRHGTWVDGWVRTLTMSFCWLAPTDILSLSGLIVAGWPYKDIQASVTPPLLGSHLSQSVSNRFPNLFPRWHQSPPLHDRSKYFESFLISCRKGDVVHIRPHIHTASIICYGGTISHSSRLILLRPRAVLHSKRWGCQTWLHAFLKIFVIGTMDRNGELASAG